MCGIIGYIGNNPAIPILLQGLKKLEYRGYDSVGICVANNSVLNLIKDKGEISNLEKYPGLRETKGNIGLGHTRWATHGEPNKINSHPHVDKNNNIAVVHNGIIENYESLKNMLIKEGYEFVSDTDSEIFAHLINKFYSGNLKLAVSKTLKFIEGTFGLAVIHKSGNEIIAARRGSPLVLGIGNNEMFVASDVPAILAYTKNVVYLHDNEIVTLTKNDYAITKLNGENVDPEIHEIKWTLEQIEKKGYKHFMLKEIFDQPESISNTLRGRLSNGRIKLSLDIDFNDVKRIIIIACGTSWHSALIGKYIIENFNRIPVEVDYASEFRYRNPVINKGDLVLAISQSGETADTLEAIREAKRKNARIISLVNVVGSTIARESNSGIYLHAGPEISVASTKAFTCQLMALTLLSLYIQQEKGFVLDKDLLIELENFSFKVKKILSNINHIKNIAEKYSYYKDFFFLGRNMDFPVALEGALKLKEISYLHSEAYPAAEMKHGPLALINENVPCIFINTNNDLFDKTLSNMQEIKARKGKIILITDDNKTIPQDLVDDLIIVPNTCKELAPILNIIPLQLFAYYIADCLNLNIDKPKNLAKSVTTE